MPRNGAASRCIVHAAGLRAACRSPASDPRMHAPNNHCRNGAASTCCTVVLRMFGRMVWPHSDANRLPQRAASAWSIACVRPCGTTELKLSPCPSCVCILSAVPSHSTCSSYECSVCAGPRGDRFTCFNVGSAKIWQTPLQHAAGIGTQHSVGRRLARPCTQTCEGEACAGAPPPLHILLLMP
jgi:hypothetical protein